MENDPVKTPTSGKLVAYTEYFAGQNAGFFLPLFECGESSKINFVQLSDSNSTVIREFKSLEDSVPRTEIKAPQIAKVGQPLVHVFVRPDGRVIAGVKNSISDQLLDFVKSNNQHPEILIQVYDLLGSEVEGIAARRSFLGTVKSLGNSDFARNYIASDIRNTVWQKVLQRTSDAEIPNRTKNLGKIVVELTKSFDISISCSAKTVWPPELITSVNDEVLTLYFSILNEFKAAYANKEKTDLISDETVLSVVREYIKGGSQTNRMAILLRTIFETPSLAIPVLEKIKLDRAKLAAKALLGIRRYVNTTKFSATDIEKLQLLTICWSALSNGTSWIKADFLYYLSDQLADDWITREFILGKLRRSSSNIFGQLENHLMDNGFFKK